MLTALASFKPHKTPRAPQLDDGNNDDITAPLDMHILRRAKTLIRDWRAHTGVPGNEKADIIAKQATGWRSNGRSGRIAPQSKWVHQLLSACKRTIKERVQEQWREMWRAQKTGRLYGAHFGNEIKRTNQPYQGFSKPEASVLVQLRSGKIGLGSYLKRIRTVDSAICLCEQSYETVAHVLGECPKYDVLDFLFWYKTRRISYLGI
jgi:hypothetical protein